LPTPPTAQTTTTAYCSRRRRCTPFFRNRKWQQATLAAWQELERGDYDWAHLALHLWPERVQAKCKTDLSMAIAHGLEESCAVKPKEKKERAKKTAVVPGKKGKAANGQTSIVQ
jgi:hypothetical protein